MPADIQNLVIKKRHTVQSSSDEGEKVSAGAAYPAVEEEHNPWKQQKYKLLLEADTAIVTCGLTNFETSGLSNGKSKEFSKNLSGKLVPGHLDKYPGIDSVPGFVHHEFSRALHGSKHHSF